MDRFDDAQDNTPPTFAQPQTPLTGSGVKRRRILAEGQADDTPQGTYRAPGTMAKLEQDVDGDELSPLRRRLGSMFGPRRL